MMKGFPLAEPPEGVIAGEDVPSENQKEQMKEKAIQETIAVLKSRGPPFTEMSEDELREKAIEKIKELS